MERTIAISGEQRAYLTEVMREMDSLPCSHPASVNIDVANHYYTLTKMLRPLLVVEIGCFIGFSTLHFAQALRELGFRKIISVDAFDWDVDAGEGLRNRRVVAEHYRKKAGMEDIITYIKGYSTEIYPQIAEQIGKRIDLLYIDGDHSVKGVFADFNTYYNDVRVGGHIILHDIYPSMCGVDGPRTLIDGLKMADLIPDQLELLEMQTKDGFGIAVLRKVSSKPIRLSSPRMRSLFKKVVNKIMRGAPHVPANFYKVIITVVDAKNGKSIPGALFVCPQRWEEHMTSGEDGTICLEHYLPNRYLIDISAEGYASRQKIMMDISAESSIQKFNIKLQPEP